MFGLHFDGFDCEGVALDGAFDDDVVSGVRDEGVWVGDLVDLIADDEYGGGAALDAFGGTVGAVGFAFGGAHGIGDEALEGLGIGACGGEDEGEDGDRYEFFHKEPPRDERNYSPLVVHGNKNAALARMFY
jgi:hypothetical protein